MTNKYKAFMAVQILDVLSTVFLLLIALGLLFTSPATHTETGEPMYYINVFLSCLFGYAGIRLSCKDSVLFLNKENRNEY